MKELNGKVALITGSSRGLGRGTALALAQKGVRIIVNYSTHSEPARETVELTVLLPMLRARSRLR